MQFYRDQILSSEIINQKKQIIFKVQQTSDFIYPNEQYDYIIYIKNISGVPINDIHIITNNSPEIELNQNDHPNKNIGDLEPNEAKLIFLKAHCCETGVFNIHFVCYGQGTGLFNQTLNINCNYEGITNDIVHRIYIYNFSPYEDTFTMTAEDFNDDVTQLIKTQKLPYKAKEQPFPMIKNGLYNLASFINQESESYLQQYNEAKNTKEHEYQYIGRENFNASALEVYEGRNLEAIIEDINENSQYFKAKFFRTGTNQLLNHFQEYSPNGFIYRFGLLSSDIYHYLGVLPSYSYMSDYIFRWAPDDKQPPSLIPKKREMNWDTKRWNGGWIVYQIATEEYQATDEWKALNEKSYQRIASFDDKDLANSFIDKQKSVDADLRADIDSDLVKYNYLLVRNYLDTGVFFVNIPFDKIPTNFIILSNDEIDAIIQKAKPCGAKGLIRYELSQNFDISMEMISHPRMHLYTEIPMSMYVSPLKIQTKTYDWVYEYMCGEEKKSWRLTPYNPICRTWLYHDIIKDDINFNSKYIHRRLTYSDLWTSQDIYTCQTHLPCVCDNFNNPYKTCKNYFKGCINSNEDYATNDVEQSTYATQNKDIDYYPDNNIDLDMEYDFPQPLLSRTNNTLIHLRDGCSLLYYGGANNFSFRMKTYLSEVINKYTQQTDDFLEEWADQHNTKLIIYETKEHRIGLRTGYKITGFNDSVYNMFDFSIQDGLSGLGFIDSNNKYHFFEADLNQYTKKYTLTYKTSYNYHDTICQEGFVSVDNIDGLAMSFIKINDIRVVIFYFKKEQMFHYFTHTIISNIKDVFEYEPKTNDTVNKEGDNDNSQNNDFTSDICCGYRETNPIIVDLPHYEEYNTYSQPILKGGQNWISLYKIDKSEDSYTYIQNDQQFAITPDDIIMHFDNINIPNRSKIHQIYIQGVAESNVEQNIYCSYSSQDDNNFESVQNNKYTLKPKKIDIYKYEEKSLYYIKQQNFEDDKALTDNINFNNFFNIDMDQYIEDDNYYITIQKPFWVEMYDFTNYAYSSSLIDDIVLTIEGYNHGEEITLATQLASRDDLGELTKITIESGYFYHHIPLSFAQSFITDTYRLRLKFLGLNHKVDIYNSYLTIDFKNKTEIERPVTFIDECSIYTKNKFYLNSIDTITTEELNNGFTVHLSFDEINPGTYYRIYYAELVIVYSEQHSSLLVNADKFVYQPFATPDITVSGNTNTLLSGQYYNDVATVSQIYSDVDNLNHGIELKDSIYQAFIARADNITSIELHPNGFIGNPSSTLKIGVYTNHKHSPGTLIKEIYVPGWIKTNTTHDGSTQLNNLYSIKYNLNITGLTVDETYWFKIEVLEPKPNSYYLLHYSTNQVYEFKMLLKENNDLINSFGSLEFSIYSKNESKSFSQLPSYQNYFNNPYVLIGLHKFGTIQNLKIKKSESL